MSFKAKLERLQQLCVYGFIRMQSASCTISIPDVLKELCFAMYLEVMDTWNIETSHGDYELGADDDDDGIIAVKDMHKASTRPSKWRNAFGSLKMTRGDMHRWSFQMMADVDSSQDSLRNVMIGIMPCKLANRTLPSFFCDTDYASGGFAYYAYDGNCFHPTNGRSPFSIRAKKLDVVTMTLDLRASQKDPQNAECGSLSFEINGKTGPCFLAENINIDKEYYMAMTSYRGWETIKMWNELTQINAILDATKMKGSRLQNDLMH